MWGQTAQSTVWHLESLLALGQIASPSDLTKVGVGRIKGMDWPPRSSTFLTFLRTCHFSWAAKTERILFLQSQIEHNGRADGPGQLSNSRTQGTTCFRNQMALLGRYSLLELTKSNSEKFSLSKQSASLFSKLSARDSEIFLFFSLYAEGSMPCRKQAIMNNNEPFKAHEYYCMFLFS